MSWLVPEHQVNVEVIIRNLIHMLWEERTGNVYLEQKEVELEEKRRILKMSCQNHVIILYNYIKEEANIVGNYDAHDAYYYMMLE